MLPTNRFATPVLALDKTATLAKTAIDQPATLLGKRKRETPCLMRTSDDGTGTKDHGKYRTG